MSDDNYDPYDPLEMELNLIFDAQSMETKFRSVLQDIRDLARTGLAPDTLNMTDEQWAQHRMNKIARMANEALEEK